MPRNQLEALVRASKGGSQASTEQVLTRFEFYIRSLSLKYFAKGAEPHDVAQELRLVLVQAIQDYDTTKGSFEAYAVMVLKKRAYNAVRTSNRDKHQHLNNAISQWNAGSQKSLVMGVEELGQEGLSVEEAALKSAHFHRIEKEIKAQLSNGEWQVLELYSFGADYQAIAKAIGKSPKSCDNALMRVRRKLRFNKQVQELIHG